MITKGVDRDCQPLLHLNLRNLVLRASPKIPLCGGQSWLALNDKGFSVQGRWRFQVSVFRFQCSALVLLTPDT
jgi:hypothetical protein